MKNKRRTLAHSFRDAFRGVWECLRRERNMRVHCCAAGFVLFFGFRVGLSRGEMALLCGTIGAVTAMETMNTAVEKLCDFTERRQNPHIRLVKDLAAGAVVLTALGAVGVGLFLFLREETWKTLAELITQPVSCVLLVLAVLAALGFIVLGPRGIRELFRREQKQ